MPNAILAVSLQGAGISISKSLTRTADNPGGHEITMPVAVAGTLSTRTDDDTGVLTLGSGHGITTSDTVDVYWDGGVQYGCTVTATDATTITIDSGSGDVLPAQDSNVTASIQISVNTLIDGDELEILGLIAEYTGTPSTISGAHVDMQDSGSNTIEEIDLVGNVPRIFDITGGDTNVFTGNPIETMLVSNGDATNAATLKLIYLQDSTP